MHFYCQKPNLLMSTRGRPTKTKQVELEEKFYQCYLQGYTAPFASKKLGTDPKTGYRYYEKISEIKRQHNKKDFLAQSKENLEQAIFSFDYLLDRHHKILDSIDMEINQLSEDKKPIPYQLLQQKILVLKEIKSTLKEKISLQLQEPFDETLDRIIEEKIENLAKS